MGKQVKWVRCNLCKGKPRICSVSGQAFAEYFCNTSNLCCPRCAGAKGWYVVTDDGHDDQ